VERGIHQPHSRDSAEVSHSVPEEGEADQSDERGAVRSHPPVKVPVDDTTSEDLVGGGADDDDNRTEEQGAEPDRVPAVNEEPATAWGAVRQPSLPRAVGGVEHATPSGERHAFWTLVRRPSNSGQPCASQAFR
jgi:hypothetical protein